MNWLAVTLNAGQQSVALMGAGAVALYLASRAAADALAGGRAPSGGRLAVGHWVPVATVAVVAAVLGQFAAAVGIVFATAVGCLSLGMGTLAVVAPVSVVAPPAARRTWLLLVPAAVLALMAGFHRELRSTDAIAIGIEGLAILYLWTDRPAPAATATGGAGATAVVPTRTPALLRPPLLVASVGLAIVGAALAVAAMSRSASAREAATPGLLTPTVLAPLVVLPALGSIVDWSTRGPAAAGEAASGLVGLALLDVCGGLPLVAAAAAGRRRLLGVLADHHGVLGGWDGWSAWLGVPAGGVAAPSTQPAAVAILSAGVPFPVPVWRVDLVAVVALALALVPIGLGRYPLSRVQGVALIAAYAAYLGLTLYVHTRGV